MTDEAQRIAIAEACGWKVEVRNKQITCTVLISPEGNTFDVASGVATLENFGCIPDFLNDLNAMHEAEATLTDDQQKRYIEFLVEGNAHDEYCQEMLWDSAWLARHATARQRAEAFLRTIGKWEDGK